MQLNADDDWEPQSGLDVLLVLLYANDGVIDRASVEGITRLDKLMFMLSKTQEFVTLFENDYEFTPYNFGPYATELLDDIEALGEEGFIQCNTAGHQKSATETRDAESIDEETGEEDVSWVMYPFQSYSLTSDGVEAAERLYNSMTSKQKSKILEIKRTFNRMPLTSLLKYVYEEFPESASKSLIRDDILQ